MGDARVGWAGVGQNIVGELFAVCAALIAPDGAYALQIGWHACSLLFQAVITLILRVCVKPCIFDMIVISEQLRSQLRILWRCLRHTPISRMLPMLKLGCIVMEI